MYTDFCVWRNNYGILATKVNPVTAPHGVVAPLPLSLLNLKCAAENEQ